MSNYKEITVSGNQVNAGNADTVSQIYRGISTVNSDATSINLYDADLIKQDLLNHFNIRKGKKIYNANFGTIIWDVLFEPMTENIKDAVMKDALSIFDADPRINATNVTILQKDYGIQLYAEIEFIKIRVIEKMIFDFDQQNGLSLT